MYREVTRDVQVEVEPYFSADRSRPQDRYFCFVYRIRITNLSPRPAQLVARHWIITDGSGRVEHVRGPGVVGETPRIEPGETFEYASYCPLPTPTGNMRGSYQMVDGDGQPFDVRIPLFFLREPQTLH